MYRDGQKVGRKWWGNHAVQSLLSTAVLMLAIYSVFGLLPLFVHTLIVAGAIIYLETINYIEHYGLLRNQLPDGSYEKTTILHSWNAPHRFSNYLLFKLQRHSDHHENASKPYQTLVSMQESPFLPHGYNLMVLMAFFPSVLSSFLRFSSE